MVNERMTTEEIEVRVWAWIVMILAGILLLSVCAILGAVIFVDQNMDKIAPIDEAFLGIMKDIMLLCIGAVGGIVGRKGAYAAASVITKKDVEQ
jgi:TM2 domain-containing membrane protein YozV